MTGAGAALPWVVTVGTIGGWTRTLVRARRQRALTARASHEVRGPLTAASLALHLARRAGSDRGAALRSVERELRRAGHALDDLRAASQGRPPADRPTPVRLGPLLARQAETWRPVAWSVGTDLRLADGAAADTVVKADPERLAQATSNLIANALEHGGGTVTLGSRTDGEHVRIEVSDDGAGSVAAASAATPPCGTAASPRATAAASAASSAAGRFPLRSIGRAARARRRASRDRGRSGRGLGLSIVADIAARHGGRLETSVDPAGSRAVVELPVARSDR